MLQLNMDDLSKLRANTRCETFDTLRLIASEAEQLDYQKKVPIAHVSAELFCSWEACYQDLRNLDWYQGIFSEHELQILTQFDVTFETVCSETDEIVPYITDFIKTKQWVTLSNAAKLALSELSAT